MVVVVQGQGAEDIVVLVDGLTVVAFVLLVPPLAVGVAVVALLNGRIDEAAVLRGCVSAEVPGSSQEAGAPCTGR